MAAVPMTEWRLFEEGTIPEWTTPEWYAERESAPHLEQEGHRERLQLTQNMCLQVADRELGVLVDLGAGDGGLLSIVSDEYHLVYGFDLQQSNVLAAASRGVSVSLRDVVADPPDLAGVDVVVATEMLEHLLDPHRFVQRLREGGDHAPRWLVASSPYTENDQGHYGFHTWAWDLEGYRHLLESNGWKVLRQETAWISQVLLAERA